MKKIIVGMGIVGMILISFASAGLFGFLSNSVSATVSVEGPVFYLDNINLLSYKDDSGYLRLNDDSLLGTGYPITLSYNRFYSDSLGVNSFYPLDFDVILNMKVFELPVNSSTNETYGDCTIEVEVLRVNGLGGFEDELCSVNYIGLNNEEYESITFTCSRNSTSEIYFDEDDRLELELTEQCDSTAYMKIDLQEASKGTSYIRVVAK